MKHEMWHVFLLLHVAVAGPMKTTSIPGRCTNDAGDILKAKVKHDHSWQSGGLSVECRQHAENCKDATAYSIFGTDSDGHCRVYGSNGYPTCFLAAGFIDDSSGGSGTGKATKSDSMVGFTCFLAKPPEYCNSWTGTCPANHGLVAKPGEVLGADAAKCCKALCTMYDCPAGYKKKSNAATITGSSYGVCCDKVAPTPAPTAAPTPAPRPAPKPSPSPKKADATSAQSALYTKHAGYTIGAKRAIVDNSADTKETIDTGTLFVKDESALQAMATCIQTTGCKAFTYEGTGGDENTVRSITFKDFFPTKLEAKTGWVTYQYKLKATASAFHACFPSCWFLLLLAAAFSGR